MRLTLPRWGAIGRIPSGNPEAVAAAAPPFEPRRQFPVSNNIIRSYYLGHHAGGLAEMRSMLSDVGLIVECRDARVPLTSINPMLESSLAGRERIIAYLKSDLAFSAKGAHRDSDELKSGGRRSIKAAKHAKIVNVHRTDFERKIESLNRHYHSDTPAADDLRNNTGATKTVCIDYEDRKTINRLLEVIRERAVASESLTGLRALIVGMPNVGKSTLINSLRAGGMNRGKAARSGAQPGVTQKLSSPVRIIAADEERGIERGVYVIDTPGVFVPYVADPEAMLKLALVGCVKDGLIPAETVADYLLYSLNIRGMAHMYAHVCAEPTNDVDQFLTSIARRTGKLLKGGEPAVEAAATWVVQQFRQGRLGTLQLDDLSPEALAQWRQRRDARDADGGTAAPANMSQARKMEKERRRTRNAEKQVAIRSGDE